MAEIKAVHEIIQEVIPHYKKKGEPDAVHTLTYESYSDTLEPVYYFLLDLMEDFGFKTKKLVDNFSSSTGSPYFSEMGQRLSVMQQQGSKMMADVGVLMKSVLNIIYDLKEFKIRIQSYEDLKSKDKSTSEGARLALKRIWIDKVDSLKGGSSINNLALGQLGFQTLIDAFLIAKTIEDVDKLELNDRVKRILKQRVHEFNIWVTESEKELTKRYEIERNWLQSQVNNLKLYARWARPHLRAAQNLEAKDEPQNAALVKAFNRAILELTLFGKRGIRPKDLATDGTFPADFAKMKFKRNYNSCLLMDFVFRAVPQQGTFIGKVDITFRAYALNDDEIAKINEELDKSDLATALGLIDGITETSLKQIEEDIQNFLDEKPSKEEEKAKAKDQSNPILALLGFYDKPKEKKAQSGKKEIKLKKDDWYEKNYLRAYAAEQAADSTYAIFDVYKKAHGMVSFT